VLKALRDQYKGENPAAMLPQDHAGMVQKVLERQAAMLKPKIDFGPELSRLKAVLERFREAHRVDPPSEL
jgi:hypothetical protein